MQSPERPESPDRYRDDLRQARHDTPVQEDAAPCHLSNFDELLAIRVAVAAPTEPQVTDVTAASTSRVVVRDDERVVARVLGQPGLRRIVEHDVECPNHAPRLE